MDEAKEKQDIRILVVDDVEVNLIILEEIIKTMGYQAMTAQSVKEAVELMQDTGNLPQIILSDISMPDIDGFAFCTMLKKNPYTRNILFKCIHNIASASHTNPCHIADFYEKRKRQSQVTSTKPHTIASIHRLIRTMYYLITHNKLYDYTSIQNR